MCQCAWSPKGVETPASSCKGATLAESFAFHERLNPLKILCLFESPGWSDQFFGMRVSREPLYDDPGGEVREEFSSQGYIRFLIQRSIVPAAVPFFESRSADYIKEMDLHGLNGLGREETGGRHHFRVPLTRQTQNDVYANGDVPGCSPFHCVGELGNGMSTANAGKRFIPGGLKAVLEPDHPGAGKVLEMIENIVRDAIGAGSNGETDDVGVGKRLPVKTFQNGQRSVRIAERLEISQEFSRMVTPGEKALPAQDLLAYGLRMTCSTGAGASGIAVNTTFQADRSVAVGACQTCVQGDLLHAAAKRPLEVRVEIGVC